MKSLIVGMGFGNAVYKPVLEQIGSNVITVDPVKPADFKTVEEAIAVHTYFDTVNICTPNFTHESIARRVASNCGIIFVEKPGVVDSTTWKNLIEDFPNTKFMMVKNNQYRDSIQQFKELASNSKHISIIWNNKNRIPNPGSWFTTKELAFGGVSRDLLPHMLSYYACLTDYTKGSTITKHAIQHHFLKNIDNTDYGTVDKNGIYNVDDFAELEFSNNDTIWTLSADWKNDIADDVYISFDLGHSAVKHTLGLCPESAYKTMIETAIKNLNNKEFWTEQFNQDMWIHQQLEAL
jgi:predicted dehydrogenase